MTDFSYRDIPPTPAGGNNDRQEDRLAAVRRALPDRPRTKPDHDETTANADYHVEPVLASQRFIEEANQLSEQKERRVNHLFRPRHLKLLAWITGAGLLFVAIAVIIRNLSEINKKITEYRSLTYESTGRPAPPRSIENGAPEKNRPDYGEKSRPEGETASDETASGENSSTNPTGDRMVSKRKKERPPASEPKRSPRDKPASRTHTGVKENPPVTATRQNSVEDSFITHFNDEQDDYGDNITQFYEPVNAGRNAGRTSSRRSNRYSHAETPNQSSVRRNRTRMIAGMVHSFGGTFMNLLEHNGDYYKMKLSLPDGKVEAFKIELAKKTIIASFSVSTISSMRQTSIIVLEMHSR